MATYRNALEAAYLESQKIHGVVGGDIAFVLGVWSARHPLALTDAEVARMRVMLAEAGASKCLSLFNAALRGAKVLA